MLSAGAELIFLLECWVAVSATGRQRERASEMHPCLVYGASSPGARGRQ